MIILAIKIKYWRLKNYLFQIGKANLAAVIVGIFILTNSIVNIKNSTQQADYELNMLYLFIGLSLYWLLECWKTGIDKKPIDLDCFCRELVHLVPKQSAKIFFLNSILALIKRISFMLVLTILTRLNFKSIFTDTVSMVIYLSLIELNKDLYTIIIKSDISNIKKKIAYLTNLIFMLFLGVISITYYLPQIMKPFNNIVIVYGSISFIVFSYNFWTGLQVLRTKTFHSWAFSHEVFFKNTLDGLNSFFMKTYSLLRNYTKNKYVSFAFAKELTKIIMEKKALGTSLFLGTLFVILPFVSQFGAMGDNNICGLLFLNSVAFFAMSIATNFSAREYKDVWLLRLCGLLNSNLIIGKLLANYCIASIFSFYSWCIYKTTLFWWSSPAMGSESILVYCFFLVIPNAIALGIILGTFIKPKATYYKGRMDYSYSGIEILYSLLSTYIVALPVFLVQTIITNYFYIGLMVLILQMLMLYSLFIYRIRERLFKLQS